MVDAPKSMHQVLLYEDLGHTRFFRCDVYIVRGVFVIEVQPVMVHDNKTAVIHHEASAYCTHKFRPDSVIQ